MWLAWAIPLLAVVFLWSVNEFFPGRLKNQISGTLALLIFALCAVAFVVSGWMMGLAALVGSFILAALARAPALWVAKKFVEYPDLGADEYSRKRLENTLGGFGSPDYFKRLDR